jgi:hypothetical protein
MAILSTGSIAFTAFNADEDGWSLVSLIDIDPNQNVFFSDGTATSATNIGNGESSFRWNTGSSTISAGSIVRFSSIDTAARASSVGTFTPVNSTNFGLSATSETLYAFLGTNDTTPTTLLSAISTEPTDALSIVGLTNGVNAIRLTASTDFAEFNGSRTNQTSFANYRTLVNTASNWNINVDGDGTSVVPNSARFSAASAAVPEPMDFLGTIVALFAVAILKRKFSAQKLDR